MKKANSIFHLSGIKTSWIIVLGTIALQAIFVLPGLIKNGIGFPLDDAWIHQTYARNLIQYGSWSFIPGVVSGGSTSPLWTILLAPGFFLGGNFFYIWTLVISCAALCGLVYFLCRSIANIIGGNNPKLILLVGLLSAMEWHLQWATASGMETILYSMSIVLLVYLTTCEEIDWTTVGIISGLIIWIRPDGLTLLGPLALIIFNSFIKKELTLHKAIKFLLPYLIILGCYLVFNYILTGTMFPNTFYAKQMEYKELLDVPLWKRIINEFSPLWVGVCLFLIPGLVFSFARSVIKHNLTNLGFLFWTIGYVMMFAIRLPVIYQHGRYIIPVIPIVLLFGVQGWSLLLERIRSIKIKRVANFGVWVTLIAVSVAFYIRGMGSYITDVKIIDTFMVQPAKWINQNTNPNSVVAVHDIGAMGFYGDRKLIDLAGLINPEIIPFIRNEELIGEYIRKSNADYYVGFSDWYGSSGNWGQSIKVFNMIVDDKIKEVDIIKVDH